MNLIGVFILIDLVIGVFMYQIYVCRLAVFIAKVQSLRLKTAEVDITRIKQGNRNRAKSLQHLHRFKQASRRLIYRRVSLNTVPWACSPPLAVVP